MTVTHMHLNEQKLQEICELMGSIGSIKAVCEAAAISEGTLYGWRARCERDRKAGDLSSPFYFEFRGEMRWFTAAASLARAEALCTGESIIRTQAIEGITEVVRDSSQRVLYALEPQFIGRDDTYVMLYMSCGPEEVPYYRLLRDERGLPIPETRTVQVPSQLKLAVLQAAAPADYAAKSHQQIDVHHSGSVVHEQKPLQRKPGERPSASLEELRALAALSPEERRKRIGASKFPTDANGRRTLPQLAPPMHNDAPDDQNLAQRPAPESYKPQPQPQPPDPGRPSYAKPSKRLDKGEEVGRGEPPSGGFSVTTGRMT